MDIKGKSVLVTGAATGIGRASAVAFAEAGAANVVIADIDEVNAKETAALVEDRGALAHFVLTDVGDSAELRALFAAASEATGGLDIVHNNAGLVSGEAAFADQPLERIETLVRVNFLAMVLGTRLAVDAFGDRGGAVVNTASIAAMAPMPTDPPYSATKAGVVNFTQSVAESLKESHRIRVNAVLPGMVDTPIINKTGDGTRPAEWLTGALGVIKMITPDEIAAVVLDLVRDETKNGETVVVMNEMASS